MCVATKPFAPVRRTRPAVGAIEKVERWEFLGEILMCVNRCEGDVVESSDEKDGLQKRKTLTIYMVITLTTNG